MKDETEGIPIIEFVGLRAKMYSIKTPVVKKDKIYLLYFKVHVEFSRRYYILY